MDKVIQLPTSDCLTGKEHEEYVDDIAVVMNDLIDKVVATADKHDVDRDAAMKHFAWLLSSVTSMSTFENWKRK